MYATVKNRVSIVNVNTEKLEKIQINHIINIETSIILSKEIYMRKYPLL